MRVTVLPELTAESVETAERLGRLSAEEGLDPAEAEYLLTSGLTAVQRVTRLWRIIRDRIGTGLTGPKARELLLGLLVVVDKNLALAVTLKEPARIVREELGPESEVAPDWRKSKTNFERSMLRLSTCSRLWTRPPAGLGKRA